MPRIPVWEPQYGLPAEAPAARGDYAPLDMLSGPAVGMGRFAQAGAEAAQILGETLERQKRQDELDYLLTSMTDFAAGWREFHGAEVGKIGRDTYGNVERAEQWIKEKAEGYLERAPSEDAKKQLQLKLFGHTDNDLDGLARLQARERKTVAANNLDGLIDEYRKSAYLDPGAAAVGAAQLLGAVQEMRDAGVVDDSAAEKLGRQATAMVYGAALDGLIDRDPAAAGAALQTATPHLSADQLADYPDRIEAAIERRQNKAARITNQRVRDLASRADDGLASIAETGSEGMDLEAELRAIGTEEASRTADVYARKKRIALDSHLILRGIQDLSFQEKLEAIDKSFVVVPGEPGAAEKIQARDLAIRTVRGQLKDFLDDPAASVAPLAAELTPPGESLESTTRRSLDLQRQMGEGLGPRFRPAVLGKERSKQLKQQYDSLDADGKLAFLEGLNDYGEYRHQVMAELTLGAATQFAKMVVDADPVNLLGARTLIEAANLKESDIPGDDRSKGEIKKKLRAELDGNETWEALQGLAQYQPQNMERMRFVADLEKGLTNASLLYGDAAKAVKLLDDTYDAVAREDLGFVVYPKKIMTRLEMEQALGTARSGVRPFIAYQEAQLGKTLFDERVKDLEERGIWVNDQDGKGFVLLNPTTGLAVTDAAGNPFRVTIDALVPIGGGAGKNLGTDPLYDLEGKLMGKARLGSEVVAGYDITSYATDPQHGVKIGKIYSSIADEDIAAYIARAAPRSPVTADMVQSAAKEFDVNPRLMVAIMMNDSALGTKGKGARTRNPGNVGNDDEGNIRTYETWEDGVRAVAEWLARHKIEGRAIG